MLIVREGIDRRDSAVLGKLLDVALRERADHRAVQHTPHDPRRIFDGLAAPKLNVGCGKKHHVAAEFADAYFERHAGAGGRL